MDSHRAPERVWTEAEDELLACHYPAHGAWWSDWELYLPGAAPQQIEERASRLGLACERRGPYTDEETAALIENISIHDRDWPGWDRVLPGRSWRSKVTKAKSLGLTPRTMISLWTLDERKLLLMLLCRVAREVGHSPRECVVELIHSLARYNSAHEREAY